MNVIPGFSAILVMSGCAATGDLTVGQSSDCEVHHVAMTQKRVEEIFGMRREWSLQDTARERTFPHADEPSDTGACMRSFDYVTVYVQGRRI